jgi:hypothetical protein
MSMSLATTTTTSLLLRVKTYNRKYAKDSDIANDNHKYAVGNDGFDKPLAEGNDEYDTLSFTRAQACRITIGYSWLDGLLRNPWPGVQTPQVLGYSGLRD